MKILLNLLTILLITSCASYIKSFHNQIDQAEGPNRRPKPNPYAKQSQFSRYKDARPIQNPVTLGDPSAITKNQQPEVQRHYEDHPDHRYKASDLLDNDPSGSLWNGKHGDNFLFVTNNIKKEGDIVIVEVKKSLKNEITSELDRNFPEPKTKSKKDEEKKSEDTAQPATADANNSEPANKVYDKIPTKVVERINNDYLLLRGRKEVIFRKFKRYIQFQAVVSSNSISDTDTVSSDNIIEPHVTVMRY